MGNKPRRKNKTSRKQDLAFSAFDDDQSRIKSEKEKARELRAGEWWKRCLAKGVCHYCGCRVLPAQLTMDHLIPLSRGGKTTKANVVCACKQCNTQKKYLLPMEWEQYLKSQGDKKNSGD